MKFLLKYSFWVVVISCLLSCSNRHAEADAYGSFEANEIIIAAQSSGTMLDIAVKEG